MNITNKHQNLFSIGNYILVDSDEDVASSIDDNGIESSESDAYPAYELANDSTSRGDPYPTVEKKHEILAFWNAPAKGKRKWSVMTNRYPKLAKLADGPRTLRKWSTQLVEHRKYS